MHAKTNSVAAILICCALLAVAANAIEYSPDAKMILPKNYREWVFLSSGLGMTYIPNTGANVNPHFDNVFVNPEAYQPTSSSIPTKRIWKISSLPAIPARSPRDRTVR